MRIVIIRFTEPEGHPPQHCFGLVSTSASSVFSLEQLCFSRHGLLQFEGVLDAQHAPMAGSDRLSRQRVYDHLRQCRVTTRSLCATHSTKGCKPSGCQAGQSPGHQECDQCWFCQRMQWQNILVWVQMTLQKATCRKVTAFVALQVG